MTWDEFHEHFLAASRRLAALDFDGTLARITPEPDQASIEDQVLDDLALLARHADVAVVSGRPRSFLEHQLARVVNLELVSNFGRSEQAPPSLATTLATVAAKLSALEHRGAFIERKPTSVTIHVREHPELSEEARALAETLAKAHGLELMEARAAWELLIPSAAHKGTAVAALLARGYEAAWYAGDDRNDVEAIRALRASTVVSYGMAIDSGELPASLALVADEVVTQAEFHRRLHVLAEACAAQPPR
jgi:trehalose 6-phosphate phosphatase